MTVTWDVRNPVFQLASMRIINALFPFGDFTGIRRTVAALPGDPIILACGPRSGSAPPFVLVRSGRTVGLFLTGVTTVQDGLSVFVSSSTVGASYRGCNIQRVVLEGASIFAGLVHRHGLTAADRFFVSGHSYGGSLAQTIGFIIERGLGAESVHVLAFGSPRFADARFHLSADQGNMIRVMNVDDPVPRFPPHSDEAPTAYLTLPSVLTDVWTGWVQCGPGVCLDEGGRTTRRQLPPLRNRIGEVNMLEWAVSPQGFSSARHACAHYLRRLQALVDRQAADDGGAGRADGAVPAQPLSVEVLPTSAPLEGIGAPLSAAEGVNMRGRVPVSNLAYKQRFGDGWVVSWVNHRIAGARSRANAGTVAARFNGALRRLFTVDALYRQELHDALDRFLDNMEESGYAAKNGVSILP